MKFPKLIAVDGEGAKLWQTGAAPRGDVQLATGYIELNGERLGAPPDPLIGSILAHCPTPWMLVDDERGRRPVDVVLRGSVDDGFGWPRRAATRSTRKGGKS